MSKNKPITENDCLLKIERVAKLIAYSGQDKESLEQCRKALRAPLEKIASIRKMKADKKAAQEAEKYAIKMGIKAGKAGKQP